MPGRQWFALEPPVEARLVRIVCGLNAARHELANPAAAIGHALLAGRGPPASIGFFEAGFAARGGV